MRSKKCCCSRRSTAEYRRRTLRFARRWRYSTKLMPRNRRAPDTRESRVKHSAAEARDIAELEVAQMLTNKKKIHIEWGDCDPAGIVYYPRYFAYFDNCTSALFEAAGLPKRQMLKTYGLAGIPMVDTRARFIAPSKFGDEVVVESSIVHWNRSSFEVYNKLFRGDILAVECWETRVWAGRVEGDPEKIEGRAVPDEVIAR